MITDSDRRDEPGRTQADAPGLIVAGMHRSGTSLVTSILIAAGWFAQGKMIGATRNNRRGHFENWDIHQLHRDLLRSYRSGWDRDARLRELRRAGHGYSLEPLAGRVDDTVRAPRTGPPWVWKNPRATLFLKAWAELLPEARFVLCVRHPAAVADSLRRRKNAMLLADDAKAVRIRRTYRRLSLWHSYNSLAYAFARAQPERAIVVGVPDDVEQLSPAGRRPSAVRPGPDGRCTGRGDARGRNPRGVLPAALPPAAPAG